MSEAKYEWTDSGIKLLQTIENVIAQSGGSLRVAKLIEHERHMDYQCAKRHCFYCEQFDRLLELELPPVMIEAKIKRTYAPKQTYAITKAKSFMKSFDRLER